MPEFDVSLDFHGVVRHFGPVRVLDGVSGRVGPGEVLLIRGPNGSGKSTLLRCVAGLLRPQDGTVTLRVHGRELAAPDRRSAVGYVAPDLAFYEALTARENLELFARLRGVPVDRVEPLLRDAGVPPDRFVRVLSSGQRQRLRWAWALLHDPPLLLLDEPFQNLDADGEERLGARLRDHRSRGGAALVASPSRLPLPEPFTVLDLPGEAREATA